MGTRERGCGLWFVVCESERTSGWRPGLGAFLGDAWSCYCWPVYVYGTFHEGRA